MQQADGGDVEDHRDRETERTGASRGRRGAAAAAAAAALLVLSFGPAALALEPSSAAAPPPAVEGPAPEGATLGAAQPLGPEPVVLRDEDAA